MQTTVQEAEQQQASLVSEAFVAELKKQRDDALDRCTELSVKCAMLVSQLQKMATRIEELEKTKEPAMNGHATVN